MGIADPDAPPLHVSVDGRRRRLAEVMTQAIRARSARTVFILEDSQWIDEPSDDIFADLAATFDATPAMFITTYRPEFRGALHRQSDQAVTLEPLPDSTTVRLATQLLGKDPSLAGLPERIAVRRPATRTSLRRSSRTWSAAVW